MRSSVATSCGVRYDAEKSSVLNGIARLISFPFLCYAGKQRGFFMQTFHTQSAGELRELGRKFSESVRPGVVALSGELGAGKTTFAQGVLLGLDATGPFTSPTFVIMKQYDLAVPKNDIARVYHVDAYRVDEEDLRAQGFLEWASDPEGLVLLEWPERAEGLVPETAVRIFFSVEGEGRKVRMENGPPVGGEE